MVIGKKGSVLDIIYIAVGITITATFLLIFWHVWDMLAPNLAVIGTTAEINRSIAAGAEVTALFDYMVLGLMVGLMLVLVILALLIESSPVFYIVYVLYMVITALITPIFSNIYEQISGTAQLAEASAAMPMTAVIMNYFPIIFVAFGVILLIATFAKQSTGGVL